VEEKATSLGSAAIQNLVECTDKLSSNPIDDGHTINVPRTSPVGSATRSFKKAREGYKVISEVVMTEKDFATEIGEPSLVMD